MTQVFSAGLGTSCDFFTTLINQTRPNNYSNTAQHQLRSPSVEPLLSQPHPVSCNRIFLFLYSTSMFVSWLFFRGFSQTISPVSQGSSKL